MEPDRYKKNHMSYIMGMVCLMSSMVLFFCSVYLLPYLFWGWHYRIPALVINFMAFVQEHYHSSRPMVAWLTMIILDLPAALLFIIADILSNQIDSQIDGLSSGAKPEAKQSVRHDSRVVQESGESKALVFKILMIIVLIFILGEFFQWAIS